MGRGESVWGGTRGTIGRMLGCRESSGIILVPPPPPMLRGLSAGRWGRQAGNVGMKEAGECGIRLMDSAPW